MRGTGADRPVVAMRPCNGAGAKGPAVQFTVTLEVNPSGEEPTDRPRQN